MRRLLIVFVMLPACTEPSDFEQLSEQPPSETEASEPESASTSESTSDPASIEPCTLESLSLPSHAEVLQTGIDPERGEFWMRLGTLGETCDGSSSWGGWTISIVFEEGRPVPGTYDLTEDPGLSVSGSYWMGKTDGMGAPLRPGGLLQVLDVEGKGIVEGVLCGVQFMRDTEFMPDADPLVNIEGQFTAGPC